MPWCLYNFGMAAALKDIPIRIRYFVRPKYKYNNFYTFILNNQCVRANPTNLLISPLLPYGLLFPSQPHVYLVNCERAVLSLFSIRYSPEPDMSSLTTPSPPLLRCPQIHPDPGNPINRQFRICLLIIIHSKPLPQSTLQHILFLLVTELHIYYSKPW